MTKTTICNVPQEPPHQFMTAEYHSIVYGAKINPRTGQYHVAKTPVNQVVKKYRMSAAMRGKIRPTRAMSHIS